MNETVDKLAPGRHAKLCLVIDLLIVFAGMLFSASWDYHNLGFEFIMLTSLALIGWCIAFSVTRLYSPYTSRKALDQVVLALLCAVTTGAGLFITEQILLNDSYLEFSPILFSSVVGIGVILTQVLIFEPLSETETPQSNVLIIGTDSLGIATYRSLSKPGRNINVSGFISLAGGRKTLPTDVEAPLVGTTSEITELLSQFHVDEIYLAADVIKHGREMQDAVKVFEELGIPFAVPLHSLRLNRAQLMSDVESSDGYLHYINNKSQPIQWAMKRLIDIVGASAGLLLLSPLLIGTALAIKIGDGGPVFFKQNRVGLHGVQFTFLKFRSMVLNAESLKDTLLEQNEQTGPAFKMADDPRVTRVGRFIRKFSIDELPQLINILRGDMTIVGPRPPVPREVALYQPWQRRRLSVRPGLTCYWQVGGRNEIGFEEWMLLDLRYVDHWSLQRDVELVLKTIPVVVFGRGAS